VLPLRLAINNMSLNNNNNNLKFLPETLNYEMTP
jgi:hypothetical protein